MAARSASGLASQSANVREPIAVVVRSSAANSEPSRRPSRIVRRDFETAAGRFVEFERFAGLIGNQPVEMGQRAFLRFSEIVENRPGGAERRGRRIRGRSQNLRDSPCRNVWRAIARRRVWPNAQADAA